MWYYLILYVYLLSAISDKNTIPYLLNIKDILQAICCIVESMSLKLTEQGQQNTTGIIPQLGIK